MTFATALAVISCFQGLPVEIPVGKGLLQVDLAGTKLELYTYKPADFSGEKMIMVFHGVLRNADEYRDHSIGMGDRFRALIVAPKFDSERFPSSKYQFGGLLTPDRTAAPKEQWTYSLVPKIYEAVKTLEKKPAMKYWIIGHSAGGQFVGRMSAFLDTGAERIVAANPSSWTFPTKALQFGYGLGGLPDELSTTDVIKSYLARPLTVYLGTGDNEPDDNTDMSDAALVQGAARWQRGRAFFLFGKTLAERRKWPFGWTLVEAEGIYHDHGQMFDHPSCEKALFGPFEK